MKHVFRIVLTIGLTIIGLMLAWQFRPTLILFISSISLAATLRPIVGRLEQRGLKRSTVILVLYLVMIAFIGGFITLYIQYLQRSGEASLTRIIEGYDRQVALLERLSGNEKVVRDALPNSADITRILSSPNNQIQEFLLSFTGSLATNFIFLLAVLALTFYWLMEITHFERLLLSLLPIGSRLKAHSIWLQVEGAVGAYIRATIVTIIFTTALLFAAYALVGIPLPMTLAILGGFAHLVPRIGPILGILPVVVLAYLVNPIQALIVVILGVIIQIIAINLNNRIMQLQNTNVSPLLQSLILLSMVQLSGFWGLLLGPPLAAMFSQLYPFLVTRPSVAPLQREELELLETELQSMRDEVDTKDKELQHALQRSSDLLEQAREIIPPAAAPVQAN